MKNGDEVTITATYNKNRAEQAGYLVESDTYTFTVEGLDEMLTDDRPYLLECRVMPDYPSL